MSRDGRLGILTGQLETTYLLKLASEYNSNWPISARKMSRQSRCSLPVHSFSLRAGFWAT